MWYIYMWYRYETWPAVFIWGIDASTERLWTCKQWERWHSSTPILVRVSFTWCSGMDINPWMGNIQYIYIYIYRDSHEGWMTVQHLPCFDHVTDECTSSKTSQELLFYTNVLVTRCDTILWVSYNFCTRHNLSSYLHFSGYIFMFLGIWLMGILTWVEWVFEAERIPAAWCSMWETSGTGISWSCVAKYQCMPTVGYVH